MKKRLGNFEIKSMANTMGGKTKAEPRSGCKKMSMTGKALTKKTLKTVKLDSPKLPILERANTLDTKISVPIFAGSEGWIDANLKLSHRKQPKCLWPRGVHKAKRRQIQNR